MESSDDPGPSRWTRSLRLVKDSFSIKKTINMLKKVARKYGWKIAGIIIVVEAIEHFVIPSVLISVGLPHLAIVGGLPIAEFTVYPILFKILGGSA